MIRILAVTAILVIAPVVQAADDNRASKDVCMFPSQMAKAVMTQRQRGGSLAAQMEKIDSLEMQPVLKDLARKLAVAAYGVPAHSNENLQDAAITEFQNQTYLNCLKGTQ